MNACPDDALPRACADKFEQIAESLTQIQADTAGHLNQLEQLNVRVGSLVDGAGDLDRRTGRLEEAERQRAAWRKRLWQLLAGAALVALGALLN